MKQIAPGSSDTTSDDRSRIKATIKPKRNTSSIAHTWSALQIRKAGASHEGRAPRRSAKSTAVNAPNRISGKRQHKINRP